MQISATEVEKLLSKQIRTRRLGDPEMEFKEITLEDLPESKVAEPSAAEVARFAEIVKAAPDIREDVVMRLKERMESGEYKVSGEEVADMMVRRMKADRIR